MLKFIKSFFIFIVLYHILVTIICYGFFGGQYQEIFSLIRDGIWIVFVVLVIATHRRHCRYFLRTRKRPLIMLWVLLVFWIAISRRIGKSWYDILIGIKYGLRYLIILITAARVGYSLAYEKNQEKFMKFLRGFISLLVIIVVAGFLRQIAKLIVPGLFKRIGYGPLSDFKFWDKPPIYYLTWFKWTLRRQGIFAGPNNYGYFLIAFLPVIILFFKQKFTAIKNFFTTNRTTILNISAIVLRILAIVLTLSRTAFIWWVVALALINVQWIRKHKGISRWILAIILAGLIGLSLLKRESTLGHIQAKFGSIKYIIDQPGGYGLGTSWPAIHHNGTILPENYYMQLMLDIWTFGFILRAIVILQFTRLARRIQQKIKTIKLNTDQQTIYMIRRWLNIGWVCLLIMGMFLHVFEDSMVNYLFFISRGILTGYLSTYIRKRD